LHKTTKSSTKKYSHPFVRRLGCTPPPDGTIMTAREGGHPVRVGARDDMNIAAGKLVRPIEAFALLLLVIFTTELAVMDIFAPLFSQLNLIFAALIDATLMVVVASLPLWIIFSPIFSGRLRRDDAARRALGTAFVQLTAGFFFFELLVMLVLPTFLPDVGSMQFGLADAALTTLFTAPLLWWLLLRLERDHHRVAFADLLESPLLFYLLLLYVIFLADLLQAIMIPGDLSSPHYGTSHVIDAFVLTMIMAPFLWLFVARPLRRSVQSERVRARAVYEQVIDAVVLTDAQGQIVALNPAAQRIFSFTEAELVGRPVSVLFEAEHQGLGPLLTAAADNRANGSGVSRELSGRHRYGGVLSMDVSVSRILLGGREDFLLIMRDISDRKEAERALRESDIRFREVYEQSEDAIFFCKPGTNYIIDSNATTHKLFGYDKLDMRGQGLDRLIQGEDLSRIRQALGSLRPGSNLVIENVHGLRRDGTECIVSLRAKVMTLQGVELVYCTLRDVTEQVRLEHESREIQAKLIQTNKMTSLGLLVSGVAHEINNPNNFIMTNAQLLANSWQDSRKILREYYRENGDFLLGGIPFSEFDDQSPRLLNGILDGSRRINQIIATLKQQARPEHSGIETEVDVNQTVASAITVLQHELVCHTDRFEYHLVDDLPRISGNSQQLGQVIINLLMNACQALPARDHGIYLATGFDPAAAMVIVTVRDEGRGIPIEDRRRIMEPFFTTKLDSGGTGLGLSICDSIVAEHRGTMDFVSVPGKGTTFTVKLPAIDLAAKEAGK